MARGGNPANAGFPSLEAFDAKLVECTITPLTESHAQQRAASFVRTKQLKTWLNMETIQEKVKNIECLVDEAYRKYYGDALSMLPDYKEVMEACPMTFCILLAQEQGHLIDVFMTQDIIDAHLHSIHVKDLEDKLWRALEPDTEIVQELVENFDSRRWAYLGYVFRFEHKIELPRSAILPIYKRQQISRKGGTASIHQLCIPEDFLDEKLRRNLAKSAYNQKPLGKCFQLAVKTFEEGDKFLFEREIEAYRHLKDQKGMVQFLGAYTHRNQHNHAEHNILLEYGDYDLAEYFQVQPPVLPSNVGSFWHNLGRVASALSSFHDFTQQRRGQQQKFKGWHADLKPDNILSVQGTLKLVDPGFAGFLRSSPTQLTQETNEAAMTSTYGPPECYLISQATQWPQFADIWALGCVLSEAATWLILGPTGLREFTALRAAAVSRIVEANRLAGYRESISSDLAGLSHGDYFHDGKAVLPEVLDWHAYLRSVVRPTDPIATHILDLVDQKMLLEEPRSRIPASSLSEEMQNIEATYPVPRQSNLSPAIEKAIQAEEARLRWQPPVTAVFGQELSIQDRKSLKPKAFAELSWDEAARVSDMVKEAIQLRTAQLNENTSQIRSGSMTNRSTITTSPDPIRTANIHQGDIGLKTMHPNTATSERQQTLQLRRSNERKHTPQDIFDAHYKTKMSDVKADEKKKKLTKWLSRKKEKEKPKSPDELLCRHYNKRDIKFIVDNAASMQEEWSKATFVLEKLAQKAAWIDDDGMELEAVHSPLAIMIKEETFRKDIEDFMGSEKVKPRRDVGTDMRKLGDTLYDWLEKFKQDQQDRRKTKSLTLIVLTDGRWTSMTDPTGVEDVIVEFDNNFKSIEGSGLLTRYVSIQFISFGDDPDALYRLRHLDNDLKYDRRIDDIVDTEHWTGDVYKMLLGSLVPDIDLLDVEPTRDDTGSIILDRQETVSSPGTYEPQLQRPVRRESERIGLAQREDESIVPRSAYQMLTTQPFNIPQANAAEGIGRRMSRRDPQNSYYRYPT